MYPAFLLQSKIVSIFCRRPRDGQVWIISTYNCLWHKCRWTQIPHLPAAPVHAQLATAWEPGPATTHLQPLWAFEESRSDGLGHPDVKIVQDTCTLYFFFPLLQANKQKHTTNPLAMCWNGKALEEHMGFSPEVSPWDFYPHWHARLGKHLRRWHSLSESVTRQLRGVRLIFLTCCHLSCQKTHCWRRASDHISTKDRDSRAG